MAASSQKQLLTIMVAKVANADEDETALAVLARVVVVAP